MKKNSQQKKALKEAFAKTKEGKEANKQSIIASSIFLVFFIVVLVITFNMAPFRVEEILPWSNALTFFGLVAVYFDGRRSGALSMYREDHTELVNMPIEKAIEEEVFGELLTPEALQLLANIAREHNMPEDLLTPAALELLANISKEEKQPEEVVEDVVEDTREELLTPCALEILGNISKDHAQKEEPKEKDDFAIKMEALNFDLEETFIEEPISEEPVLEEQVEEPVEEPIFEDPVMEEEPLEVQEV